MRGSQVLLTAALTLLPIVAGAQQAGDDQSAGAGAVAAKQVPAAQPAAAAAPEDEYVPTQKNVIDFGVRGTNISGDSARYERYRDLGNGLFLERFKLNRETKNNWFLDVTGDHVGRLDQRFLGSFERPGRFKASAKWDQIPMLMSRTTQTLFTFASPNVLTLDDALQTQVQASAGALASFIPSARGFDTKSRRYIAEGGVEFLANRDLTLRASFRHMDRDGVIPFGGSFGHSNVVETPAPVRHQLTDFDGGAEFVRGPALVRGGYAASFFHNDFASLTFDNPWRAVDISTASSRGRTSLPPSNSLFTVNGLASVKLPGHSRASAYFSTGLLKDSSDTSILPQTINVATTGLQPLERTLVEGQGRTAVTNLTFTSRPSRYLDVTARYRYYDYKNQTPEFAIFQRVSFDNAPAVSTTPIETEPFAIKRSSFDGDIRVRPQNAVSLGIGFSRLTDERTFRIFGSTTENVARVTVDSVGTKWFALRTKYEHSQKRGTINQTAFDDMVAGGEQPGMRQFDLAPRDRNRATVLASVMPGSPVSVNLSIAAGKDDYLQSLFGLRDNKHKIYGVGLNAAPGDRVILDLSYDFENYRSLSRSRQSNPGVQFTDESRNWATNGNDRVHSVIASAEVLKIADKVDLKFSYDYNRATSLYTYTTGPVADRTLPEESTVIASSLPPPTQLPNLFSGLNRATADLTYSLTPHVGIGLSYWYERYRVTDFTLDSQAIPRLDLPGALLIGYGYLPYTANTAWGRLICRW